jgi:hypothetical protein
MIPANILKNHSIIDFCASRTMQQDINNAKNFASNEQVMCQLANLHAFDRSIQQKQKFFSLKSI